MKKKVLAVILGAVMVASMAGCGGSDTKTTDTAATETTDSTDDAENTETAEATDGESYTIGISQFAEHGSLDNCREGFLEGLKEEGIEEGKNLTKEEKEKQYCLRVLRPWEASSSRPTGVVTAQPVMFRWQRPCVADFLCLWADLVSGAMISAVSRAPLRPISTNAGASSAC